jgi:1-pyrroline-5-carboxylate dehydrogenase
MPHNHKKNLCTFPTSTPELAAEAIEHALAAQNDWEALPFAERAAVFLKVSFP